MDRRVGSGTLRSAIGAVAAGAGGHGGPQSLVTRPVGAGLVGVATRGRWVGFGIAGDGEGGR